MRHHLWLGLGLLLGLLLLGLGLNLELTQSVQETQTHLRYASEAALMGEEDLSRHHARKAQAEWEQVEGKLGWLVSQSKLDAITGELELLLLTDPGEERPEYLRSCRSLVLELSRLVAGKGLGAQNLLTSIL